MLQSKWEKNKTLTMALFSFGAPIHLQTALTKRKICGKMSAEE